MILAGPIAFTQMPCRASAMDIPFGQGLHAAFGRGVDGLIRVDKF